MMYYRAQQLALFATGCVTLTFSYAADSNTKTPGALKDAAGLGQAQDPMAMTSLWQLTLGMLLVLGLIVAIAWVLKRSARFQMAAGGGLRILGGLSMGTRERVVLLQVGETQLLVGVAPGRVQTLHILDKPLESTHGAASAVPRFADQLGRLLNKEKIR
jgi:flagellar protein FliO/FliZ